MQTMMCQIGMLLGTLAIFAVAELIWERLTLPKTEVKWNG